jgi:hypothetical protein
MRVSGAVAPDLCCERGGRSTEGEKGEKEGGKKRKTGSA